MESVNQHRIRQRIAHVYDTMHGAQAQSDDVKKYVKSLQEIGGIESSAGTAEDFMSDFGKGL